MAPKRGSPLDEPPTASSSDEEEEVSSEEEEEGGGSSEEEEEEEKEEEEPAQLAKPSLSLPPPTIEKKAALKKPPVSTTPQPQSSSSESESDSGSETEDDQRVTAADAKVKPIASKPMEEASKKNTKVQPTATPSRSGTKRSNEHSRPVSGAKRAKGTDIASSNELLAVEDGVKKPDKKLFQRLWSEDDEIAILNGMHEYWLKNGADPYKNMDLFHDSIKESLHIDVARSQLMDKIWRLKKKYEKNVGKGKNDEDPKFTKPHDKKIFEISKKVWGSEGTNRGVQQKSIGKIRNIKKGGSSSNVASSQAQQVSQNSKGVEQLHADQSGPTLSVNQMIKLSGLSEDVIRKGFESLEASERAELEERWKNLQLLELEFFVKRAELIRDQSKVILEAYKSSNH